MKIAQDAEGRAIRPLPGGRGLCPSCKTAVRAHCGEIYEWHWHHEEDVHCDYYWEPETAWHRRWKAKFPTNWVEVIITKNGKTHIADVQTPSGLVIGTNSCLFGKTQGLKHNGKTTIKEYRNVLQELWN